MTKVVVIGSALALLTVAVIVLALSSAYRESCEVCVTFHGRSQCRGAYGQTREEAIRTATDNACAFLAAGMTDSIECQNTPPDRVVCAGE
jgi:hypothetical protein